MDSIGQQSLVRWLVRLELDGDLPDQRCARVVERGRGVESDQAGCADDVPLPATPGDGQTATEHEAVAWIDVLAAGEVGTPVQLTRQDAPPPIGDKVEQVPTAALGVAGLEDAEVGGEVHQAVLVPIRAVEVHDTGVGMVFWIDREVDQAVDTLVGACWAEDLASRVRPPCVDC